MKKQIKLKSQKKNKNLKKLKKQRKMIRVFQKINLNDLIKTMMKLKLKKKQRNNRVKLIKSGDGVKFVIWFYKKI